MILKERDAHPEADKMAAAGARAEQQLAFYLKRGFGEDRHIHVFNDVRLEHANDAVQIDHLILHPYGFVIVESKSVHDQVAIDRNGHWSRRYRNRMHGMGSPLLQGERQMEFLQRIFRDRRAEAIGTFLGFQQSLDRRTWDLIVAISDNGVIRSHGALDPRICKADEVVGRVRELHKSYTGPLLLPNSRPKFSVDEMDRIADFLVFNHSPAADVAEAAPPANDPGEPYLAPPPKPAAERAAPPPEPQQHACSKCGGDALAVRWGPYGYYFKCAACDGNTAIRETCEPCGKPLRIRKQGLEFFAECAACGTSRLFFTNPAEDKAAATAAR